MLAKANAHVRAYGHEIYPQRVVLTEDAAGTLSKELLTLGRARALIVCSPRMSGSVLGQNIRSSLAGTCVGIFDDVDARPTLESADRGAVFAREAGIDCLIALGGGSAIDLAKCIAMLLVEGPPLARFAVNRRDRSDPDRRNGGKLLPLLAVPTTLSGAECTPGAGLCDSSGHKLLLRAPEFVARVVVLDPIANLDVPVAIVLSTGINAIAHCIEALYSLVREQLSDAYATQGFVLLHRGLTAMLENPRDIVARADALNGAHLAGRAIVNVRTSVHAAACHVIGATGVAHGVAHAILLPHVIRFNAQAGGLLAGVARGLGASTHDDAPDILAEAVEALCRCGGLPYRLRDVGIEGDRIPELASAIALEPGLRFNPRQQVNLADLVGLLTAAW